MLPAVTAENGTGNWKQLKFKSEAEKLKWSALKLKHSTFLQNTTSKTRSHVKIRALNYGISVLIVLVKK